MSRILAFSFLLLLAANALGQAFETLPGLLPATPPVNAFIDKTAPEGGELFYRILKP